MIEEYEEIKPTKGLNFRLLVKQLTDGYKLKVCLKEANPSDIFKISDKSNEYLVKLIKQDVKESLPVEQKRRSIADRIRSIF